MCGIFGASFQNKPISHDLFSESLELIHHRGPDSTGKFFDDASFIAFGHKRLSIIDLTDHGSQPMSSIDKKYQIIFNGEIYNFSEIRTKLKSFGYKFFSSSDTEVLLNAYIEWGAEAVKKFRGMFSFAIYDKSKKIIFLARDCSGEKPLFYSIVDGDLLFGSELKPLLNFSHNLKFVDRKSFSYLFQNGYTPKDKSIFKHIYKLQPGSYLTFDLTKRTHVVEKFWKILSDKKNLQLNLNENQMLAKLDKCLEDAVNLQLNSDVPLAILLSGGLDSSLITSVASRSQENLNTFTVSFDGHGFFDEAPHAELISKTYKTNHHVVEAKDINPEIISKLTYYFDDPMFDPSMIPSFLVAQSISKKFKVALSGDGGDELFGGYNHYTKLIRLKKIATLLPLGLRKYLSQLSQNILPIGARGRKSIELFSTDFSSSYANVNEFFSEDEQVRYFSSEIIEKDPNIGSPSKGAIISSKDYLLNITINDFKNYLSEDLLVKMDRASMANSVEFRTPFLDRNLIEFAFNQVPSSLKVDKNNKKILLKKLASRILPPAFDANRKQGFAIPLSNFLHEKRWREYFYETIIDFDSTLINKTDCLKMLDDKSRLFQNAGRLFGIIFFIHWIRTHRPEL